MRIWDFDYETAIWGSLTWSYAGKRLVQILNQ